MLTFDNKIWKLGNYHGNKKKLLLLKHAPLIQTCTLKMLCWDLGSAETNPRPFQEKKCWKSKPDCFKCEQ